MTLEETYERIRETVQEMVSEGVTLHEMENVVESLLRLAAFTATTPVPPHPDSHANIIVCSQCFILRAADLHAEATAMPHRMSPRVH